MATQRGARTEQLCRVGDEWHEAISSERPPRRRNNKHSAAAQAAAVDKLPTTEHRGVANRAVIPPATWLTHTQHPAQPAGRPPRIFESVRR